MNPSFFSYDLKNLLLIPVFLFIDTAEIFPQAGQLDPTFGQGGIVSTAIKHSGQGKSYGMKLQSDGKIVTCGYSNYGDEDFEIIRYNSDGTMDNGFGTNGVVITDVGNHDITRSVEIQSDGKIVAAGYSYTPSTFHWDFMIVRHNWSLS